MAEEKIIPGVATEKESDEVLEEIRTQTKEVLNEVLADTNETRSDSGSRLFFQ